MIRFHHTWNPVPSRTSHNAVIGSFWTVIPVLILVVIAIPSFKLMYYMDGVPNADMTIKVTGNQWFWSYEYPDQNGLKFDSKPDRGKGPEARRQAPLERRQRRSSCRSARRSGCRSPGSPRASSTAGFMPRSGFQE